MKSKMLSQSLLLTFFVMSARPQEIDQRIWSIQSLVTVDRSNKGRIGELKITPATPLLETSPNSPPNNADVRVRATTNTVQSEVSIAVSPLNKYVLLVSANTSDHPITTFYGTGAFWSVDGGQTWAGFDQPPSGNENLGDPAVAIDRNAYFYIGSIAPNSGQGVMRSTNGGSTWAYYQVANLPSGHYLLDKNHLAVDNNNSSPYQGKLYAAWTDFPDRETFGHVRASRSTNQGADWVNEQTISGSDIGQGANLQTGPDGSVYAIWAVPLSSLPYTELAIGFNKSTNGGQTWGTASRAINNIRGIRTTNFPPYSIRANSFPSMAVSQLTGYIYVVWTNVGVPGTNTGDPDIYLIKSTNGGTNWSLPVRVNNDQVGNQAKQWFPWITVDPITDQISVVFYDGRNYIGTATAQIVVAQSSNGGVSFDNFVVSDVAFTVGPLPDYGGNYNGDYIGITARGGFVYPTWNAQVPSENSQVWISPIGDYVQIWT